ncbi:MAG: zinc ribbon domain-containing protein [Candidatus Acidiferrales bacterium]
MSRFQDNLSVIPRAAKVTAWIVALGCAVLVGILSTFPPDHSEPIPLVGRILLPILAFATLFTYIALIGYVYGDSKRRGMRYVMWTLLAIFIPDAIGIILYFILRDAMPIKCPSCGTSVLSKFTFCPSCGTSVKPTCSHCGKAVDLAWTHCAHCGSTLPGHLPRTA